MNLLMFLKHLTSPKFLAYQTQDSNTWRLGRNKSIREEASKIKKSEFLTYSADKSFVDLPLYVCPLWNSAFITYCWLP